ncbi:DUF6460 domain-containing protein [Oharaeibacter diazotrophicus]|uniref:DUF6460 domain-containing protein n=1 Tax=Oharaeibacter diazotrophicus TaxID=1920512 RepID=A0A4R6R996_9HYPH|nr:DUF6460 domain-containing protein [Oharaeibacter diazotrophicus]TDP82549.1 hypothetical protein EDD54_3818 [Oharaeibacter diazotrophicus]BBE72687.1 hypothetical protein OHA_1_02285 [Pleomorphomonas sp. SM30]GLS76722.1 hypothetical protein GCM10007904_20590 [Oharaeibacter diazotrophicus]
MSGSTVTRILGDTPGRVLVRLVLMSFVVGVIMAALGIEPYDIVASVRRFVEGIWNLGFGAIDRAWRYFLLGAVVVVPLYVLIRLMKVGGGRT